MEVWTEDRSEPVDWMREQKKSHSDKSAILLSMESEAGGVPQVPGMGMPHYPGVYCRQGAPGGLWDQLPPIAIPESWLWFRRSPESFRISVIVPG